MRRLLAGMWLLALMACTGPTIAWVSPGQEEEEPAQVLVVARPSEQVLITVTQSQAQYRTDAFWLGSFSVTVNGANAVLQDIVLHVQGREALEKAQLYANFDQVAWEGEMFQEVPLHQGEARHLQLTAQPRVVTRETAVRYQLESITLRLENGEVHVLNFLLRGDVRMLYPPMQDAGMQEDAGPEDAGVQDAGRLFPCQQSAVVPDSALGYVSAVDFQENIGVTAPAFTQRLLSFAVVSCSEDLVIIGTQVMVMSADPAETDVNAVQEVFDDTGVVWSDHNYALRSFQLAVNTAQYQSMALLPDTQEFQSDIVLPQYLAMTEAIPAGRGTQFHIRADIPTIRSLSGLTQKYRVEVSVVGFDRATSRQEVLHQLFYGIDLNVYHALR